MLYLVNDNFKSILWVSGSFGIIGREHAEELIYTGKYGKISANTTFSKLEREYRYLKRIDRGKRKPDAYVLTKNGAKEYKRLFGEEAKIFKSGDKLSHSIQILNFYSHVMKDMLRRNLIKKINIIEDKNKLIFNVHEPEQFIRNNKNKIIISDAFCIYKYQRNKAKAFILEIENSDRRSNSIASKTIENYEGYYLSKKWMNKRWQPKDVKVFPMILVVAYSNWKMNELIKQFQVKTKIDLKYYFSSYEILNKEGISGKAWFDINKNNISIFD